VCGRRCARLHTAEPRLRAETGKGCLDARRAWAGQDAGLREKKIVKFVKTALTRVADRLTVRKDGTPRRQQSSLNSRLRIDLFCDDQSRLNLSNETLRDVAMNTSAEETDCRRSGTWTDCTLLLSVSRVPNCVRMPGCEPV
jgi:hypothetical protein